MTRPIFVASPVDVHEGDKALSRLEHTNDSRFEGADGVTVVDDARWQIAQEYERLTWLQYNLGAINDRNDFHREHLDNYAALPQDLGKVAELGCGVFTNLRFILEGRTASAVYLVDPLCKEYQAHPHCAYRDGTLNGNPVTLADSAVEDWNTRVKFDTLVMINTLPHCRDANKVLDFVRKHVKVGGYVVLGEFPREHAASVHYDAGHPIALKAHVLDSFLAEFEEVYRNGYYFIGRVK